MSPATSPRPDDGAQLALLLALRDLAGEAAAVDLGDEAGVEAEVGELQRIVERAIANLDALQSFDEPDPLVEWEELDTAVEPDAWLVSPRSRTMLAVADISFAGGLELRRVLRDLVKATDEDRKLVAAESARRKVRRAIRATLEAARESGVDILGGDHQGHHQVADVASGLAVRRLYARFRRSLRRATDDSPEAVLAAVRYAGGALATLVTSPDYADVRVADRTVLRRLRERALYWARHDRGAASGLQLIEDLFTCGDLLRGINLRQELQQHDRARVETLANGPVDDVASWFAELAPLFGMDDRLDAILDAVRGEVPGPLEHYVPEALACLARVRL
jgi:hypothetical protein